MTALALAIAAAANRYAGSGYPAGTVVLAWVMGFIAYYFGADTLQAIAVAIMAFAGRQFIGHKPVYRLDPHCAPAWFSIAFTRATLIAFPLGAALGPILLTAFACLAANYLSRKAEDRKMIGRCIAILPRPLQRWIGLDNDMLKLAEPLQGFWMGVLIAMLAGGR